MAFTSVSSMSSQRRQQRQRMVMTTKMWDSRMLKAWQLGWSNHHTFKSSAAPSVQCPVMYTKATWFEFPIVSTERQSLALSCSISPSLPLCRTWPRLVLVTGAVTRPLWELQELPLSKFYDLIHSCPSSLRVLCVHATNQLVSNAAD